MSYAPFIIFALVILVVVLLATRPKSGRPGADAADGQPCPNCGAPRGAADRFCRRCGRALT